MMYTYKIEGLKFEWHGGPYIEIFQEGNSIPFDVLNVWDYELDQPTIEKSEGAMISFIHSLLDEILE